MNQTTTVFNNVQTLQNKDIIDIEKNVNVILKEKTVTLVNELQKTVNNNMFNAEKE